MFNVSITVLDVKCFEAALQRLDILVKSLLLRRTKDHVKATVVVRGVISDSLNN